MALSNVIVCCHCLQLPVPPDVPARLWLEPADILSDDGQTNAIMGAGLKIHHGAASEIVQRHFQSLHLRYLI
jgi:hypothetical protein